VLVDIGGREEAQVLRESRARLEFALESAHAGAWELDLASGRARCSRRCHSECFGTAEPVDDWSIERFLERVHPDDRADVERRFAAALAEGATWDV